ncbi:preprotein translocase subunit SecG [Sphingobacterium humi]|uniref:Protein-export membrane protein SecG n=1 Tax=Sphingobacterium humi TaxID=1796905 RepID=A0A6N8L138_9SPHI|nr:preprotein translocase subunit SecG [Sphingobacterium humi]MVZ63453.1 preprotein translocase subunit SecG [Sphingobacterium humi]
MTTLFIILIILVSLLLSFFVLIQNPKGGGLSSGFSGGANLMGVQRTGDILEKGTWILIISLMVFSIAVNVAGPSAGSTGGLDDQIEAPVQGPSLNLNPTATPIAPSTGTEAPAAQTPAATDSTK